MDRLLLFGVRSPLTPDYEETCARLGLAIAGAVQVDDLAPRVLDRERLVALAALTGEHRRAPYVTCAFDPARRAALAAMAAFCQEGFKLKVLYCTPFVKLGLGWNYVYQY